MSDITKTNNAASSIIEATKYQIDKKVRSLPYDTTVKGVVVDASRADDGIYKVRIQNAVITAVSLREKERYEVNQVVYVQIPQGDFDNEKFIIGKEQDVDNSIYNYSWPFDDFIQLKQVAALPGTYGYRANQAQNELTSVDDPWNLVVYENDTDAILVGNRFGIQMIVQSLLDTYKPISGEYGVRAIIDGQLTDTSGGQSVETTKIYELSTRNMWGNPYGYLRATKQQIVFDVSEFKKIDRITFSFYQDCDFKNLQGEQISWHNENGGVVPYNIIISNLEAYFGFSADAISSNKVFLLTQDALVYNTDSDDNTFNTETNEKEVHCSVVIWKDALQKYVLCDTEEELTKEGIELYWYVKDNHWALDTDLNKAFQPISAEEDPTILDYQRYGGNFWAPISKAHAYNAEPISRWNETPYSNMTSLRFLPNLKVDNYTFKVCAVFNGTHLNSDALTFSNYQEPQKVLQSLQAKDKLILRPAIMLYVDSNSPDDMNSTVLYPDESFSNFYVYDENNRVLNTNEKREFYWNKNDGSNPIKLKGIDNAKWSNLNFYLELWMRDDNNTIPTSMFHDNLGYVRLSDWLSEGNMVEDFEVSWDVPSVGSSMMIFNDLTENETGTTYFNQRAHTSINFGGEYTTQFALDVLTTKKFSIREAYDITRRNNVVSATVTRKGQTYTAKREFMFGRSMAQGSEYTPVISIMEPEGGYCLVSNQRFALQCMVYDRYGSIYEGDYTCTWEIFGGPEGWNTYSARTVASPSGAYQYVDGVLEGTLSADTTPFVVVVRVAGLADWYLTARRGMMITNSGDFVQTHSIYCPDRIEFNSTGQAPKYDTNVFKVQSDGSQDIDQVPVELYPDWYLRTQSLYLRSGMRLTPKEKYKIERLLYSGSYNADKIFEYFDPATGDFARYLREEDATPTKDSQGNLTGEYTYPIWTTAMQTKTMFQCNVVSQTPTYRTDETITNLVFDYEDNIPSAAFEYRLVFNAGTDKAQGDLTNLWTWDDNYTTNPLYFTYLGFKYKWQQPAMNGNNVITELEVYNDLVAAITNRDSGTVANICNQYNNLGYNFNRWTDFRTYVLQYKNSTTEANRIAFLNYNNNVLAKFSEYGHDLKYYLAQGKMYSSAPVDVVVNQALAFERYYYPSSLVNDWDGQSLTIDEGNGAILNTMIATGTKDYNGRFSGVMLGNWTSKGDDTFDTTHNSNDSGLWGMSHGEITYAFLDNGTGYIGPAGKGRITFDGNNAMISNATGTCYLNLNPNTAYENGSINNNNISPYFVYCKVPINGGDETNFYSELNEYEDLAAKFSWARPFLEDKDNNYFIVHPGQGALLSGGIISNYGKIGNWLISANGLYQKRVINGQAKSNQNRFMYLGMPHITQAEYNSKVSTFNTQIEQLKQARDGISVDGSSLTEQVLQVLYPYLNQSMMQLDVYHYYNSVLGVEYVASYLREALKKYTDGTLTSTTNLLWHIFDNTNLKNKLFSYEHLNMWNHNHYSGQIRTQAQFGLFNNMNNALGLINYSPLLSNLTVIYYVITDADSEEYAGYQDYNNYSNRAAYLYHSAELDGLIGEGYTYSVNPIGEKRRGFFDRSTYVNNIDANIGRALASSNLYTTSDARTLALNYVAATEMNNHWWAPTAHPKDTNGTILKTVWNENGKTPVNTTIASPHVYVNWNEKVIDVQGLQTWLDTWEIYYYYYAQFYNQVLYRMLESGVSNLQNDATEDGQVKYQEALRVIESVGGWETIKASGVAAVSNNNTASIDGRFVNKYVKAVKDGQTAMYNRQIEELKRQRSVALDNYRTASTDSDSYAVYCAYNAPSKTDYVYDPLFGVKWNGYMIARAGKIGKDSPWYISDAGLTQTNNFGTIFLGSPNQDGDTSSLNTYYTPIVSTVNGRTTITGYNASTSTITSGDRTVFLDENNNALTNLLPNGSTVMNRKAYVINGEFNGADFTSIGVNQTKINGIVDNNYYYPYNKSGNSQLTFNLTNVPASAYTYLGPEAFGEYGNFAIYAGTQNDGIRFGVRLDGTVYASRMQVRNLKITGTVDQQADIETQSTAEYTRTFSQQTIIKLRSYTSATTYNDAQTISVTISAGGSVHITNGKLTLISANQYYVYDGSNHADDTRITIVDSAGSQYYWKTITGFAPDTTTKVWKKAGTVVIGSNTEHYASDSTTLLAQIAAKDAILLGGDVTGWLMTSNKIYNNKIINSTALESIALDAGQNQIRISNGQITLDGITGIVFIGRTASTSGAGASIYTDAHLWMGNVHIGAKVAGEVSYDNYGVRTTTTVQREIATYQAGTSIEVSSGTTTSASIQIDSRNSFFIKYKDTSATGTHYLAGRGIGLVFSPDQSNLEVGYTVLYPLNTNSFLGMYGDESSGTQDHLWNVNANIVSANSLFVGGKMVATVDQLVDTINEYSTSDNGVYNELTNAYGQISDLSGQIDEDIANNENWYAASEMSSVISGIQTAFLITDEDWESWTQEQPSLWSEVQQMTVDESNAFISWTANHTPPFGMYKEGLTEALTAYLLEHS